MPDRALPSLPPSPDAGTPDAVFDETLVRAIDAGRLEPEIAATNARLAGAFAAHQKLESLFAALRGEPADLPPREYLARFFVHSILSIRASRTPAIGGRRGAIA